MIILEVVDLANGRYGVQAVGGTIDLNAGEFETRDEAEEWIFDRAETLSLRDEPRTLTPGSGQAPH